MKNGLYCSGGYNWFSIGSEGRVATCNEFLYKDAKGHFDDDRGYLGNILTDDIILRKDEFGFRCPVQKCDQVCDRHWSRKKVYEDDKLIDVQDINDPSIYNEIRNPISLMFSPTWKCNFSCKYCGLPTGRNEYPAEKWIERFSRFFMLNDIGGGLIHMTGGEPLYYKDIDKLFKFCYSKNFKIGLTTNLTGDIYKNIILCVPPQYIDVNCSLHAIDKNFNWESFKNGVQLLKLLGYNVGVNFVAHPDQLTLAPEYSKWCKSIGVNFSLIPMIGIIGGLHFKSVDDYPEPLKNIIYSFSSENLQDSNKFIDGNRVK